MLSHEHSKLMYLFWLIKLVFCFSVGEDFDEVEDDAEIDEIDQQEVGYVKWALMKF